MKNFLNRFFGIKERGSRIRTEIVAGITTFLAMAYILPVNAGILSETGMSFAAVLIATAISAGLATLAMGLHAKFPIALAPGMGVNAFFTYTVVFALGFSWEQALAAVLVSGLLFLLISVTGLRKAVINAIPKDLKHAVTVGIGFFIAFIGLRNSGFIVIETGPFAPGIPQLGDILSPTVLLFALGFLITAVLYSLKVKASIFFGMVVTMGLGIAGSALLGLEGMPYLSTGVEFSLAPLGDTFGKAILALPDLLVNPSAIIVVFTFLFVDFFDTAGTLVAIGNQANLLNSEGQLQGGDKALVVDAAGTIVGSVLGTSTVTSYIESGAGIAAGGRTGLTAVVTGVLFLLSVFLWPFLGGITSAVTAPALVLVGVLMTQSIKDIQWEKFPVALSSFMTVIMMVLSFSIAEGIAVGFVLYPLLMLVSGKGKEVKPLMFVLSALFVAYFIFL